MLCKHLVRQIIEFLMTNMAVWISIFIVSFYFKLLLLDTRRAFIQLENTLFNSCCTLIWNNKFTHYLEHLTHILHLNIYRILFIFYQLQFKELFYLPSLILRFSKQLISLIFNFNKLSIVPLNLLFQLVDSIL